MSEKSDEKITSTKKLEGKRVNGVLYLKQGVRTGNCDHIHATDYMNDSTGSSHILNHGGNKKDYYEGNW